MTTATEVKTELTATTGGVRTALAGVSGYAGGELARLLLKHPRLQETRPIFIGREATTLSDLQPHLYTIDEQELPVVPYPTWSELKAAGVEIIFLATPHEQSREWVPQILNAGLRVVDLSGAWRLKAASNRAVYKLHDADAELAAKLDAEAVFGCPELHHDAIRNARLVANPGCYATSIILALRPLVAAGLVDIEHGIVCDAKSGVSGAGKAPTAKTHFMHAADNLSAYAVFGHRHTGEVLEQVGLPAEALQFTPHLLPIPRGILSTIYLRLKSRMDKAAVEQVFRQFYAGHPLIRVFKAGSLPQIQYIVRTNYCDLGFELAADGRRMVLVSCLDNLLKGAAGQAVENMNVMCGWKEEEGLL